MERVYNHHVLNRQTGQVDYVVEESFNLYFYQYDDAQVTDKIAKGKYTDMTTLYTSKYRYNDAFWSSYKPLADHPLNNQIKKDLDHAVPLDKQFHDSGK
jgi:hypothetical protein